MSEVPQPGIDEIAKPREECGVAARISKIGESVTPSLVDMLRRQQHRGYDANGIGVSHDSGIKVFKQLGRVDETFTPDFNFASHDLDATVGIGHVRYSTEKGEHKDSAVGAHPHYAKREEPNGIFAPAMTEAAVAFNGNIEGELREKLKKRADPKLGEGLPYDTSDLVRAIVSAPGETPEDKVKEALEDIPGAFSIVGLINNDTAFATRSVLGTWPLWIGENDTTVVVASETNADSDPTLNWREVKAGEMVRITPSEGAVSTQIFTEPKNIARCVLHDMYMADKESQITRDAQYKKLRFEAGRMLAERYPVEADVVTSFPRSGDLIGMGIAAGRGEKFTETFRLREEVEHDSQRVRSYMQQTPDQALSVVKNKYVITDPELVRGKRVIVGEDSSIKGVTSGGDWKSREKGITLSDARGLIGQLRDAGATEIHLRVAVSEIVKECALGIYMEEDTFVATRKREDGTLERLTRKEIAKRLGADSIEYLTPAELGDVYERVFKKRDVICTECMGGPNPIEVYNRKNTNRMVRERVAELAIADK